MDRNCKKPLYARDLQRDTLDQPPLLALHKVRPHDTVVSLRCDNSFALIFFIRFALFPLIPGDDSSFATVYAHP